MRYFLSKLFRKRIEFKNFEGVKLKEAFQIGTIKYYEPEDLMNLPYQRALACIDAFNQLKLGIFPEDIEYVCEQVDKIYEKPRVGVSDLIRVKHYLNRIRERQKTQFRHPELMYKLASIVFIDETESPKTYDAVYAQKKIEYWKQHKSVTDFFLQIPIQRLIPFLVASEENLKYYSTLMEQLKNEENILTEAFTAFSEKQKKESPNSQSRSSATRTGQSSRPSKGGQRGTSSIT